MKTTVRYLTSKRIVGTGLAMGTLGLALMASSANTLRTPQSTKIQSILTKCATCHNPDQLSGGLDLTSRDAALANGRALVPGNVDASAIAQQVVHGAMPPGSPLSEEDREVVVAWIKSGAAYPTITRPEKSVNPKSWAFKPVILPSVPKGTKAQIANPIDAFILQGLRAKKLSPAVEADRLDIAAVEHPAQLLGDELILDRGARRREQRPIARPEIVRHPVDPCLVCQAITRQPERRHDA